MKEGIAGLPDGKSDYEKTCKKIVIHVRKIVFLIMRFIKRMLNLIQEKDFQEFIEMKRLLKKCKNG